jgi:hypothetical protein
MGEPPVVVHRDAIGGADAGGWIFDPQIAVGDLPVSPVRKICLGVVSI